LKKAIPVLIGTALLASACGATDDGEYYTLQQRSSLCDTPGGFSGDACWHSVAVFFGYPDDFTACEDASDGLQQGAPRAEFRCVPYQREHRSEYGTKIR
jgi:hypothetical protein